MESRKRGRSDIEGEDDQRQYGSPSKRMKITLEQKDDQTKQLQKKKGSKQKIKSAKKSKSKLKKVINAEKMAPMNDEPSRIEIVKETKNESFDRIPKFTAGSRCQPPWPMTVQAQLSAERDKQRALSNSNGGKEKANSRKVIDKIQMELIGLREYAELFKQRVTEQDQQAIWRRIIDYYIELMPKPNEIIAWDGSGSYLNHVKMLWLFGLKRQCKAFEAMVKDKIGWGSDKRDGECIALYGGADTAKPRQLSRANVLIATPGKIKHYMDGIGNDAEAKEREENLKSITNDLDCIVIFDWKTWCVAAGRDDLSILSRLSDNYHGLIIVGGELPEDMYKPIDQMNKKSRK